MVAVKPAPLSPRAADPAPLPEPLDIPLVGPVERPSVRRNLRLRPPPPALTFLAGSRMAGAAPRAGPVARQLGHLRIVIPKPLTLRLPSLRLRPPRR